MNIKDLQSKGFISIPYPEDLKCAVKEAQDAWVAFCSLPSEVKRRFPYSNDGAGVGYEDKTIKSDSKDKKENFDFSLSDIGWLNREAAVIDNQVVTRFIESLLNIAELLVDPIAMFSLAVENEFGIRDFQKEILESADRFFIRFIHYFPVEQVDIETAEAHTDQSGITAHLFESKPGFQHLDIQNRKWMDVLFSEGEMLIINSMQIQLRSKGDLKALCHRVISKPETAKSGRYSAVCFIQFKDTPKYDKTKGRLQDLHKANEGFNYGMSYDDFSKLFSL